MPSFFRESPPESFSWDGKSSIRPFDFSLISIPFLILYYQMGLISSFLGLFGFAIGIPLGLLVGFFLFVYSEAEEVKVSGFVRPVELSLTQYGFTSCWSVNENWSLVQVDSFFFWIVDTFGNLVLKCLILQEPDARPICELGPNALFELLPEIPLWVKSPEYERVSIVMQFMKIFICYRLYLIVLCYWYA